MKITSEDLDIIKVLEEDEPGKWLENRQLSFLDLSGNKISIKDDIDQEIKKDPELMLRAIRLSGEIIKDLDKATFDHIQKNADLLSRVPRNRLRDHFTGIITSNDAEKALQYLKESDMLAYLYSDSIYRTATRSCLESIEILVQNINKARPEPEHRWTLMLRPLGNDAATLVMNHLIFNKTDGIKIAQAIRSVDKLYFLNSKMELKKYIKKIGYDNYIFIDKIARQEKKIYDTRDHKIEARHYMLQEMLDQNEPFRMEDLAIGADILMDEGAVKDDEEAEEMLDMLLDTVIIRPRMNNRKHLLKRATQLKRNPLAKYTRKVWWRR